jgi:cell division transport system permease protein
MNTIGIVFVLILSAGMLFVCYSTVKILFYRKQKEIETYTLLGATKTFIRAPFLIEGAVIGLCGGILSLAGMLALYYFFILRISMLFPIFKAVVFPVSMVFTLPFAGLILGISGALIAIGRIRY